MKNIELRLYQNEAITAVQEAVARGQKNIVVEMAPGCGKGLVFAKTIENLQKKKIDKIRIILHFKTSKQGMNTRYRKNW